MIFPCVPNRNPALYSEKVTPLHAARSDGWVCLLTMLDGIHDVQWNISPANLREEMTLEQVVQYAEFLPILECVIHAVVHCDHSEKFLRDIVAWPSL